MNLEDGLEALQSFVRSRPTLLVGSGLSMSMGLPGMAALLACLKESIPLCCAGTLREEWAECLPSIETLGLEEGLRGAKVSPELLALIIEHTAQLIELHDCRLRDELFGRHNAKFPFADLLRHLVASAPPLAPVVSVITPNYDHIVEFACDRIQVLCCTGFRGSEVRIFDPNSPELRYGVFESTTYGKKQKLEFRGVPKVRLFKPHGSLRWQRIDDLVFECAATLEGSSRVMITPGLTKYEISLTDSVMNRHREDANRTLQQAKALLVIGYGFNDSHLETVLKERLASGMPCLVLTRSLTATAMSLVLHYPQILALEGTVEGGTHWLAGGADGCWIEPLWRIDHFVQRVIG